MAFLYCQRKEEMQTKCKLQCEHCKEYYAPMERLHKLRLELEKVEKQLDKCRTSAIQDGWQTSKYAKKSRKWDFYAQRKMDIIRQIEEIEYSQSLMDTDPFV